MKKILLTLTCATTLSLATSAIAAPPDGGSSAVAPNSLTGDEDPGQERGGCSAAGFASAGNASAFAIILGSVAAFAVARRRSRTRP